MALVGVGIFEGGRRRTVPCLVVRGSCPDGSPVLVVVVVVVVVVFVVLGSSVNPVSSCSDRVDRLRALTTTAPRVEEEEGDSGMGGSEDGLLVLIPTS